MMDRMNRALVAVLGMSMVVGCAANVDEPVQQLPDPGPQRETPVQTFSDQVRPGVSDPVMAALVDDSNNGPGDDLPPKQLAVQMPGN